MIEREFKVDGYPLVKISVRSGRVAVESGVKSDVARFFVETKDPTFEVRERGDAIVASGDRGARAEVNVTVPPGAEIEIATASADISVGPMIGRLNASTASGDIYFDSVLDLAVRTTSGNVRGARVDGDARSASSSGDIRIGEILDRAEFSTSSGDVVIDRCSGSINCSTVSGDITIGKMSGPSLGVKSMSGAVTVGIPARTRLDLDANSLSGRIRLPSPSSSQEPPERDISARIRLVSGDLRIERVG